MTPPDRPNASGTPPAAAPVPTALRRDGTAPRSLAERLRMLLTLAAICLAVVVPILVVTGLFGQKPRPKPPVPDSASNLRQMLEHSADSLLPAPAALTPEPITVPVRPGHLAARAEKVVQQAAQFGGVATEGIAGDNERHLYVDLPAGTVAAFRQAVTSNAPLASPASPAPPSAAPAAGGEQEHVEVFIRPLGDDE